MMPKSYVFAVNIIWYDWPTTNHLIRIGKFVIRITPLRTTLLSLASLLPSFATPCLAQSSAAKADIVLINGTILTVDPQDSTAEALAIRAGKITAVGTRQQILALTGSHTQIIDLHGRTATPGLIDTHGHYQDGGVDQLYNIPLSDATSIAEIVRRVQAKAATAKPGEWIRGAGWDEGKLAENRYVYASDLDKVSPNNPVYLRNTTGHYAAVNSYALRLAHITAESKNPPAGTIDRDASGAATGVLKEQASTDMLALIPPPSIEQRKQGILKSVDGLHREGMTSFKEIGSPDTWSAYQQLLTEGKLDERVCMLWLAGSTLDTAKKALVEIQKNPRPPHSAGDGKLVACGAKIFMDGSTAARTAWVYQPWHKNSTEIDAGNFGYPTVDPEVYRQMVRLFHQAGVTVGTHAIGDRSIDWVVDTYALVLKETPTPGLRHTIIHAYIPTPHAITTMATLQKQYDAAYPELQTPFLWWIGKSIAASLGPDRLPLTMPLKTYLDHGVRWGDGSDYYVTPFPARYGLWASVQRETLAGTHPFGMSEAVDIHTALRSYTAWAAPLLFLEDKVGTLEPGKQADIAIWDSNLYTIPSEKLKDIKCEMTIFNGRIVFKDDHTLITAAPAR
jgi:predicted amidohydrolase YtcJ